MAGYSLGIDLGGRSAKFGLFDKEGKLINKSNIVTRTEENGKYILPDIYNHILKILEKYNLKEEDLIGIGMGVPGAVIDESTILSGVNLGWGNINIKDYFKNIMDVEFKLANDANLAALGEQWMGAGKNYKNIVMVTLGTGVGGGIIIDGDIYSGPTGSAGEIGHIPILEKDSDITCGCGRKRCFELVASATGLENLANEHLFESDEKSSLRRIDSILAKDVFDQYKLGDKLAGQILDKYYQYLGRGLASVAAVVDPEAFVIGGGVSNAGPILLEGIRREFLKNCFPTLVNTDFLLASLANDAGIYGAARLVLKGEK